MKIVLLGLMAVLFSSCATVGGAYLSSSYFSLDSPRYAKGFDLRKREETYVIEYAYAFSKDNVSRLDPARFGYERYFASFDRKTLERLCSGDTMPVLRKQDLLLEHIRSRNFESGGPIGFQSVGCREYPVFEIADRAAYKTPAKIGVISGSLAADAWLVYLFPMAYPIIALSAAAVAAAVILPGLH